MARQPFNTRWAQGVEAEDSLNSFKVPSDVRLSTGWEGGQGKDAPPAGQENWWHNRVDSALQDIERKGAMTWHAQAVYGLGAPCLATDGYYYESMADNNAGNSPLSSPTYWRQIGQSLYSTFSTGEYKDVAHNGTPSIGWLKCNGAVVLRAAYSKLFSVIGTTYNTGGELSTQFRLPDWRGVFPRFLDDGRGIDTARYLSGFPQASQNLSHAHGASSGAAGYHAHSASTDTQGAHSHTIDLGRGEEDSQGGSGKGGINKGYNDPTSTAGAHKHNVTVDAVGDHSHAIYIAANGGAEARPINLAQVRWIRYL